MIISGWLFLYTPIPSLAAMYFGAYRHDLGRIAHPFRDVSSAADWYSVCRHLDLVSATPKPVRGHPVGGTRSLVLLVVSVVVYAASVFSSFLFVPWYLLCAIQALVAVPLFLLVVFNLTGPFPFKPYRDVLPYPRLGTRVRHLGYGKEEGGRREGTAPNPAACVGRNGAAGR